MGGLIVFDGSTPTGIVETPQSLSWVRRYQGLSTLNVTLDLSGMDLPELQEGTVLGVSDRAPALQDEDLGLTPDLAFVIEDQPERVTDLEGRDLLSIQAVEFGLLHATICYPPPFEPPFSATDSHHEVNGPAEDFILDLVEKNRGPSAPAARRIPDFSTAASLGRGDSRLWRARFQTLAQRVNAVCLASHLGYEVTYDVPSASFVFGVLAGQDRSAQVVLDLNLDTATSQTWRRMASEVRNVAVVAGQGSGADRDVAEVVHDPELTGARRREVFVDARDLEDASQLAPRGEEKLAELLGEDSVEVDLYQFGPVTYRVDFDLGDLVRVRNQRFGLDRVLQVLEVTQERPPDSYPELSVTLGRVRPTLASRVRGEVTDQATARS